MNWLKSTYIHPLFPRSAKTKSDVLIPSLPYSLASVAGTQEPIYGPEAIQSVAKQTEAARYTELTKEDLRWRALQYTNVETQTFYAMGDNGTLAMVQVIYSNIVGIHTTAQFNSKIFNLKGDGPHNWHSDPLSNFMFDEKMLSFGADNLTVSLNEEGTAYTIRSAVNEDSVVDLTFSRAAPGFVIGKDGTTYFGTDAENPWGSMHHAFWPRCTVQGTIKTKEDIVDLGGRGMFIHAIQGMKPHHAAARWNFVNFQTPSYSAVMMEFTTPPSYGSTVVNVGGIVKDNEIVYAGVNNTATHTETAKDEESEWPEPKSIKWNWDGKTADEKEFHAELDGSLGNRMDRIDVMAEVPGFIKTIAGSVAGTKPYIFQYAPQEKLTLKVKVGDEEVVEQGTMFSEATFIS